MSKLNPIILKFCCASGSGITIIPLDVIQTKLITNKNIEFKLIEFKWILLSATIFTIQNNFYNWSKFIPYFSLRGAISGLLISPIYVYLESNKLYSRTNIIAEMKIFTIILVIRQVIFYTILYRLLIINYQHINYIAAFICNAIGYPIKIFAFYKSCPNLKLNYISIRNAAFIEILKSSLGDGFALCLSNEIIKII